MDESTFWRLIEEAQRETGDLDTYAGTDQGMAVLQSKLQRLPPDQIIEFDRIFGRLYAAAYRHDLWAAAFLIGDGCSDDGFMDFRDGLVLSGRAAFERAVSDPDSLADHPTVAAMARGGSAWFGFESLDSIVGDAWSRATGEDDEAYYAARERTSSGHARSEPVGEQWDFDDDEENARRLPRLTALFAA